MAIKLRFNVNAQTVAKTANLVSNGVLLTANTYLIGSGFANSFRERKNRNRNESLQLGAEIASALASITRVVTETLGRSSHEGG